MLQKRAARKGHQASSFNKLLLRFGSLHKGFAKCKVVYDSLDEDGNEVIDLQELSIGCQKLGLDITADIISKVFSATDLDGNKVIDFREFIVVLAILYMITTEGRGPSNFLSDPVANSNVMVAMPFCRMATEQPSWMPTSSSHSTLYVLSFAPG